jgi:hypothetical protein
MSAQSDTVCFDSAIASSIISQGASHFNGHIRAQCISFSNDFRFTERGISAGPSSSQSADAIIAATHDAAPRIAIKSMNDCADPLLEITSTSIDLSRGSETIQASALPTALATREYCSRAHSVARISTSALHARQITVANACAIHVTGYTLLSRINYPCVLHESITLPAAAPANEGEVREYQMECGTGDVCVIANGTTYWLMEAPLTFVSDGADWHVLDHNGRKY